MKTKSLIDETLDPQPEDFDRAYLLLLAVVAVLPMIINLCTGGSLSSLAFGGSSIIIVVGVILETIREIEAQLTMRHYKGFLE